MIKLPEPAHTLLIDQGTTTYNIHMTHPSQTIDETGNPNDEAYGVYHNDTTTILMEANGRITQYHTTYLYEYKITYQTDLPNSQPRILHLTCTDDEHAAEEASHELYEYDEDIEEEFNFKIISIERGKYLGVN
jgi:hypothetical protein